MTDRPISSKKDSLDEQGFYEVMQAYRWAGKPVGYTDAAAAYAAFETVKTWVRDHFKPSVVETSSPFGATPQEIFNAGVTHAKYRYHYKDALESIKAIPFDTTNVAEAKKIAADALDNSPEETKRELTHPARRHHSTKRWPGHHVAYRRVRSTLRLIRVCTLRKRRVPAENPSSTPAPL